MSLAFIANVFTPAALVLMMIGLGTSLRWADIKTAVTSPRALIVGLFGQVVVLPAAAFTVAATLDLAPAAAVGLIIIACCPGGVASNIITFAVRGTTALSVTLTVISTLFCLVTAPALVSLGLQWFAARNDSLSLSIASTALMLASITVVPASIGMVLRRFAPVLGAQIERVARLSGFPVLVAVMTAIVASQWDMVVHELTRSALPVLLFSLIMGGLGLALSRVSALSVADARAVTVEIALQNTTLALVISMTLLQEPAYAVVPGVYGVVMFVAVGVLMAMLRDGAKSSQSPPRQAL